LSRQVFGRADDVESWGWKTVHCARNPLGDPRANDFGKD
jgi:hypothetical protein